MVTVFYDIDPKTKMVVVVRCDSALCDFVVVVVVFDYESEKKKKSWIMVC